MAPIILNLPILLNLNLIYLSHQSPYFSPSISELTNALLLLPNRTQNRTLKLNPRLQLVFVCKILKILPDLRRVGIERRPVRIWLEGIGIGMSWNVAGAAGIAIFVPGSCYGWVSGGGCEREVIW